MRNFDSFPAAAGVFAATGIIALTGCTSGSESAPQQEGVHVTTPAAPEQTAPTDTSADSMQARLDAYRHRLYDDHVAEVIMGACVAWPNRAGTVTITLNPGNLKTGESKNGSVPVFSVPGKKGDVILLDGPNDNSVSLLLLPEASDTGETHIGDVHVGPIKSDPDGHRYYVDRASKLPIIDTVITETYIGPKKAAKVCVALAQGKSIPDFSPAAAV